MRRQSGGFGRVVSAVSAFLFAISMPAATVAAYSAPGVGTSNNPYLVTTCAQLQEIRNDLAGHYKLMRNIDCRSYGSFPTIGELLVTSPYDGSTVVAEAAFSGTLDGNNYHIVGLQSTTGGIFKIVRNAVIKNIWLTDSSYSISTNDYAGALADQVYTSTITNTHGDVTISGSAPTTGGLIGYATSTTIEGSSFTGTVNTGRLMGGLVGFSSYSTINDSYTAATITTGTRIGGLVGIAFSRTVINRSYSASSLDMASGQLGGLIGIVYSGNYDVEVNDSFSASHFTGNYSPSSYSGAISGGSFMADVYGGSAHYDASLVSIGVTNCAGDVQYGTDGECTPANADGSDPNYFKGNLTSAPLTTWSGSMWQAVNGEYPQLQGNANVHTLTLNDFNGDGIDDSYQGQVLSATNTSGKAITFTIQSSSQCIVMQSSWVQSALNDPATELTIESPTPYFSGVKIRCPSPGASVPITVIFDKKYNASSLVLRNYNTRTSLFSTVPNVTFATATISGVPKTTATYILTEDSELDSDLTPGDGIIEDPISLASLASAALPTVNNNDDTTAPTANAALVTPGAPNTGIARIGNNTAAVLIITLITVAILGSAGAIRYSMRTRG
ncbi:MAG: hypothetical protein JWN75_16 [Candidatus Saccharibacteria bacterium]|nr:hypothetical protein [Candidatus Saccharibacteria bacterium]